MFSSCFSKHESPFGPLAAWVRVKSGMFQTAMKVGGEGQGWEFAHWLISHSHRLFRSNEQLWVIRSDHSGQMSESFRSLMTNEWPWVIIWLKSNLFVLFLYESQPWAIRSGRSPKMSDWVNHSFFWGNHSFANFFGTNWAIRSENRWVNSQPWGRGMGAESTQPNSFSTDNRNFMS